MSRKNKPVQNDRHSIIVDGASGTISLESEISAEIEIDRQIREGRGFMVAIIAAREAARLIRLSDDDLRAEYERSVLP